ncbi:MAG: hypothetical protein EXS01_06240, partial [Phycisphaerales bacterium]|nr:hypothetical protein [Phycisphaerales bacterium]
MNNHSITDEQLLARLAQLDAQVAALHVAQKRAVCSARKWKTIAWITSASVVGVGSLAATQSARTPDVIRARRFEVIDQSDKVVLLAGIGANGGQLDVW